MEWFKCVLVIAAFGIFGKVFSEYGIYLDISDLRCLPEYLYAAQPRAGARLEKGQVVSFVASRDEMMGWYSGKRIAKLLIAKEGDHVQSDESGVRINGELIAVRSNITLGKIEARKGNPVSINRILTHGEIFLMGTQPRSFDSRYWGVMQDSHIDKLVTPLI